MNNKKNHMRNSLKESVFIRLLSLLIILNLASCAPNLKERITKADMLVEGSSFKKVLVDSGGFVLTTYQKISDMNSPYIFYIDGDGFVLINPYTISDNPTPINPIMLQLATLDPRKNVIYLARPCQYTDISLNDLCTNNKYWTSARMSKEIVDAMADAIKKIAQNNKISLIGFSGGGGIAILVAPKLKNIENIITIAGNLDIIEFTDSHGWQRICDSLNPIDFVCQVKNIPQLHLSGAKDKVVLPIITEKFVKTANSKCVKIMAIESATHGTGWNIVWKEILKKRISCD